MFWPTALTSIQSLPETPDLGNLYLKTHKNGPPVSYEPNPEQDPIIGSVSSPTTLSIHHKALPYIVLTYRSMYLYDSRTGSPVSAHVRSDASVAKFGANVKVKVSPNGRNFAVETSGNVLLVYTIRNDSEDELLNVFDSDGHVLQSGYPIPHYKPGVKAYNGTDMTSEEAQGLVQTVLSVFFGTGNDENPVYDHSLRLRVILNVQSRLSDFCFLTDAEILLLNSKPRAFQVVSLREASEERIRYALLDDMKWYGSADREVGISEMHYDYVLDCFVWVNELGNCWLVRNQSKKEVSELALVGNVIYKKDQKDNEAQSPAAKSLINHQKDLVYVALQDGTLLIYKLLPDLTARLLKTINRPFSAGALRRIALGPKGESLISQYANGWTVSSFLGNMNFSTFEYDPLVFSAPNDIRFIDPFHLLLTKSDRIMRLDIAVLNYTHHLSSVAVKRPILIDNCKMSVFRAYDKKLVDQHHYNYSLSDTTGKETNIWLTESLPLSFRMRNTQIRSCCASDDGTKVCIVANRDVVVLDVTTQVWKFFTTDEVANGGSSESTEANPIVAALWWKDYLLLGSRATDGTSSVAAFSTSIFDVGERFSESSAIWLFDFAETRDENESFLSFNLDSFNSQLMVTTDELNVYTWKLTKKEEATASTVVFERSRVYQLKRCFGKRSETIRDNYRTLLSVGDEDLLLQSGTDLFYLRKVKGTEASAVYEARLLSEMVEYVQNLTPGLVCVFDGSQVLHYNVSKGQDLALVSPIKVKVGNDIESDESGKYVVNSTGTTPYPLTTISAKNTVFGVDVDCRSEWRMRMETTKRNYLDDLVNHYIESNIRAYSEDPNALGISVVYRKLHRFKQFKFVLEVLLVRYIQKVYEDGDYDKNGEYFERLYELIRLTGREYEIVLNCLKKTEAQYWPVLFKKLNEDPRSIVSQLYGEAEDYKLAAHYFTIMLNYETQTQTQTPSLSADDPSRKLKERDVELIGEILQKLVETKDYVTSFEMLRFIKLIDGDVCHSLTTRLLSEAA